MSLQCTSSVKAFQEESPPYTLDSPGPVHPPVQYVRFVFGAEGMSFRRLQQGRILQCFNISPSGLRLVLCLSAHWKIAVTSWHICLAIRSCFYYLTKTETNLASWSTRLRFMWILNMDGKSLDLHDEGLCGKWNKCERRHSVGHLYCLFLLPRWVNLIGDRDQRERRIRYYSLLAHAVVSALLVTPLGRRPLYGLVWGSPSWQRAL